jgi:tRNA G18 (ribose-2'-O)-methylase SpoU
LVLKALKSDARRASLLQKAFNAHGKVSLHCNGPQIKILYATAEGLSKISELDLTSVEIIEVSEAVMKAMSDTVSPQGLISLCYKPEVRFLGSYAHRKIHFHLSLSNPRSRKCRHDLAHCRCDGHVSGDHFA